MSKFNTLKIKEIKQETKHAVSIAFEIPSTLSNAYQFLPGQYITLRVNVNGENLNRSYSLCSNPSDKNDYRIAVKRVPGGRVSTYLTQQAKVGDSIDVMEPLGNFYANVDKNNTKTYYLFGAGSGITPLFSIIKAVLQQEPQSKIQLIYGNLHSDTIIFRNQIAELEQQFTDKFSVKHMLAEPRKAGGFLGFGKKSVETVKFQAGLIDKYFVKRLLDGKDYNNIEIFTCGPSGMMKSVENAVEELEIAKEKFHVEYFTEKADEDKKAVSVGEKEADYDGNTQIEVICDGNTHQFTMQGKETILDACSKNNVDPPFACMVGACTTCRCKLTTGSVELGDCEALTPKELEDGYILSCQAKPTSKNISVNFDE